MDSKYQNGKIYKITGNDFTYYGSTIKTLKARLCRHVCNYRQYVKGKYHYVTSYKCFENSNMDYKIELVESCQCNSKDELHIRERYYIQNFECVNKFVPKRTIKEWSIDNKIHVTNYHKQYKIDNKECIVKYNKQYVVDNKEHIAKYHKQYAVDNKEYFAKYRKQYVADNIKIIHCIYCNCCSSNIKIKRHQKSSKHINNVKKINDLSITVQNIIDSYNNLNANFCIT